MFNLRLLPLLALSFLLAGDGLAIGTPLLTQEKAKAETFANPELLVTTEWLEKHGKDEGVVVFDARTTTDYAKGHIPGSVSFSTKKCYEPKTRYLIGSEKYIAGMLAARGVEATSHILIYDRGRSTDAARLFWTLEVYGHAKVSVLDGGNAKWIYEKRAWTKEPTEPKSTEYKIKPMSKLCSTMDQVLDDVGDPDVVMLDSRTKGEFAAGRIPSAIRIEWTENYTSGPMPVFKSPTALAKLYTDQGVTSDKRVHAY